MKNINSQDTEYKILKAAEEEFMRKGFSGARTTSIAEAAGVTHAMLHYYFRTKEKIFERIISEKIMMIRDIIGFSFEDDSLSLNEMIHSLIERHLKFLSENSDLPRFLIGEVFSNPERASIVKEKIKDVATLLIRKLQNKIDSAYTKGVCRNIDAKSLLIDILSLDVFPYMASPLINAAFEDIMEDKESFMLLRLKENYDIIIRKLKP
ncbi:MAG: TetR/AcrR family transcriptional regulator [Muribaculaceae bacterium]|nr:TetR/AcrR family transcriptional regulator [Muribaculaceae bacterium]